MPIATPGDFTDPLYTRLAQEHLYFDGWEVTEGTVRNWEVRDGMDGVAGMVGDNLTVANRSGEVWRPKTLGPGKFQVQLWLAGNTRQQANDAWRTLLRACYRPHRLVRVKRVMSGGESIYCDAEVIGSIEPTHIGKQAYRATITFNVPAGAWYSDVVYEDNTPAGAALNQGLYLDDLAPSTAPLETLEFTIYGRITNPNITDNTDGGYLDKFVYNGTIPSGGWLRFNAELWRIDSGGFTVNPAMANPTGRRLMVVSAARPGDRPSVILSGSNGDSKTRLKVRGRRHYLC